MVLVTLLLIYQFIALVTDITPYPFRSVLAVVVVISFLSGIYAIYLKLNRNNIEKASNFVFLQFSVDILTISWLIIITGGIESNLANAYVIVILLSALFLEKSTIYVLTVLCLAFYFLSLNANQYVFLPMERWGDISVNNDRIGQATLGQFVICFLTAMLSGFMQTAYRSSRKDLKAKEERIHSLMVMREKIVESLPSGLLICSASGTINFINTMGLKILQIQGDAIGRNAWEIFDLKPVSGQDKSKSGYLVRAERNLTVGGLKKVIGISYSAMDMDSGISGYMVVFQDLTKIKVLEEHKKLTDRMSAIGKVAAGVAHEIRNPLASISGSVQVLRELVPEGDEAAEDLAEIVSKETKRLNDILSQFLAYARPGSPPDFRLFNLANCVRNFVSLAANDSQLKTLALTTHFGAEEPLMYGDESKITQVFWNIVKNSYHACHGVGTVDFNCFLDKEDIVLKISDNGSGMTENQLNDLFTPFQSFRPEGMGLGMSIVYDIIQLHHGSIQAKSEVGLGTTIELKFTYHKE